MKFNIEQENKNRCGVYIIRSTETNDCYEGSTTNLWKRYMAHKSSAKVGLTKSKLGDFFKSNGIDGLYFDCIIYVDERKNLLTLEVMYIEKLKPSLNKNRVEISRTQRFKTADFTK